jgi:hypothetical protein
MDISISGSVSFSQSQCNTLNYCKLLAYWQWLVSNPQTRGDSPSFVSEEEAGVWFTKQLFIEQEFCCEFSPSTIWGVRPVSLCNWAKAQQGIDSINTECVVNSEYYGEMGGSIKTLSLTYWDSEGGCFRMTLNTWTYMYPSIAIDWKLSSEQVIGLTKVFEGVGLPIGNLG